MLESNHSFWVGFGTCLAAVLCIVALLVFGKKRIYITRLLRKDTPADTSPASTRPFSAAWIVVFLLVIAGAGVSGWLTYRQRQAWEEQSQQQQQTIEEQSDLIESIRKSNLTILMSSVLDQVDAELARHPARILSDSTVARVAALSYSFKPYTYLAEDGLTRQTLSPERGHLLLALSIMGIDSVSFCKIKHAASFASVDLCGANLKGADLSGADLRGAKLRDADLSGADLSRANLKGADLWGANLNHANLDSANLVQADVQWAELNAANLKLANLNGADLSNAKLIKADLAGATFRWGEAAGAMFTEANLTGVDLLATHMAKANLTKANLSASNLRLVDFSDAHLTGVDMTDTRVGQENWAKVLAEWHLADAPALQQAYTVVSDTSGRFEAAFILKK